jgi:hypothetical protein
MPKDKVITTKCSNEYWKAVEFYKSRGELFDNYYCAFNREYIVIVEFK